MKIEIKRKIDELGRIIIPIELRRRYEMVNGDTLVFLSAREGIQVAKADDFILNETPKNSVAVLDELGRIIIPSALRKQFKLDTNDALRFVLNETCMLICKDKNQTLT